ncbi:hypothetical protein LINPERHAP2_LOCUS10234 [Linum perenne]
MSRKIPQLWAKKGGVQVSDVGFGFYVVNFETIADYERAMFGGPWMINDHYVVIQEWRPYFRPEDTLLATLRVWVRLPGIPFEYFDNAILKLIGDRIGRTIRIDHTTLEGTRGNFARICVEVDLSKPLLSKYRLRRRVRRIEYEGLHTICFNCGCYGHKDESCKQKPEEVVTDNQTTSFANPIFQEALASDVRPEVEEDFGPWMQVKKTRRKTRSSAVSPAAPSAGAAVLPAAPSAGASVLPAASPVAPPAMESRKGNSFAVLENLESPCELIGEKSKADALSLININEAPIAEDFVECEKENQIPKDINQVLPVVVNSDFQESVDPGLASNGPNSSEAHVLVAGSNVGLISSMTNPLPNGLILQDGFPRFPPGPTDQAKVTMLGSGQAEEAVAVGAAKPLSVQPSAFPLKKNTVPVKGSKSAKTKVKDPSVLKNPKSRDHAASIGDRSGPSAMEE